jgi:hypothetical protein
VGSCEASSDGVLGVIGNSRVTDVGVVVVAGVFHEGWRRRGCTELVVAVARVSARWWGPSVRRAGVGVGAGKYVCVLLVAGGIQVMPDRSLGQCGQSRVMIERWCARSDRGVAVLGSWRGVGVADDRESAVLQGNCASDVDMVG